MKTMALASSLFALSLSAAHAQIAEIEHASEKAISSASKAPWEASYTPPRTPWGTPSFEGIWTNATLTPLQRDPSLSDLTLSEEEAKAYRLKLVTQRTRSDEGDASASTELLPAGAEANTEDGYDRFWLDYGADLARVDGSYRSSQIIYPENGRFPYKREALMRLGQMRSRTTNFDNPEARGAAERCTVGYGSTGGPPMLNVLYNNNYQFAQSEDTVGILVEMNHQTRLVRLGGDHQPASIKKWLGDSVGEWDGDTLVIRTRNIHPQNTMRGGVLNGLILLSENAEVTERVTRVSDTELLYEWTIDAPDVYTDIVKGETTFLKTDGPIFEYACHEGNYALPGILAGARREERLAAEAAAKGE